MDLAAEYRDDATGNHIRRVGWTSTLLAQTMGLPDSEARLIELTAPLHDVGKLGIPDRILLKPGCLTPAEFETVKAHVLIGGKILSESRSPLLQMAETIARYHHESWDGSGYCGGLKGEGIPLAARIVAVADSFDALTHERPYKGAWTITAAMEEIRNQESRRYDPHVVRALQTLVLRNLISEGEFADHALMPSHTSVFADAIAN